MRDSEVSFLFKLFNVGLKWEMEEGMGEEITRQIMGESVSGTILYICDRGRREEREGWNYKGNAVHRA